MMRAVALLLCLLVSACGFSPLYGAGPDNSGPIQVAQIDGRTGHFLRQELVRAVGGGVPGVTGPATLTVELRETIGRLGFAEDQAASRSDYIGRATWRLTDVRGRLIARGIASDAASFNFADSPYADVTAQSAAQERVATMLARTMRNQIVIEVGKPPATAAVESDATPAAP